jgi:hypothetical protein
VWLGLASVWIELEAIHACRVKNNWTVRGRVGIRATPCESTREHMIELNATIVCDEDCLRRVWTIHKKLERNACFLETNFRQ